MSKPSAKKKPAPVPKKQQTPAAVKKPIPYAAFPVEVINGMIQHLMTACPMTSVEPVVVELRKAVPAMPIKVAPQTPPAT